MGFSFKYTRYSAIAQITLGILSVVFGIADRAVIYYRYAFHSESVVPVWMGVWFVITGVIGVYGTKQSCASNGRVSRSLIGTYLGFSIVATVFAAAIIVMYVIGMLILTRGSACRHATKYVTSRPSDPNHDYKYISLEKECNTSVAMGSLVIIFAILEFCVGIWACVCSCSNGCCDCCNPTMQQPAQMGQVFYLQTQHGPQAYIMTKGAYGVPVAVPAMVPGQAQMPAGANGVPVAVPGMVPGQAQMSAPPGTQAIQPSHAQAIRVDIPPVNQGYTVATEGGVQGGGNHDAQAPPLQTKSRDMPPVYQP